MKFASRLILSLLCLFAVCGVMFVDVSDSSAQCNAQGTAGCNAPQVSALNLGLAQVPATASASTAASASAVAPQAVFAPQAVVQAPAQIRYQVSTAPQYITVPSPQYVALPQVSFGAVATAAPQYVTAPVAVSTPQFVTAPQASASTAASASALPLVAAQPVALNSGCANGSCGGRQGLLQRFRRPVSRSTSRSFVRS